MLENIRLSIQGIWSHKMRSFLTMLGIIIGIAAIISIVSTIKGTNEQIKQNLIAQLTASVRWTQEVQNMLAAGATEFTECGPGKALQGMISKIAKGQDVTIQGV